MSTVELRRRRPDDGSVEVLARISAAEDGGPAVIEPNPGVELAYVEAVLAAGALAAGGRVLRPEDGEAYVEALPSSYRGSRLWVEPVS